MSITTTTSVGVITRWLIRIGIAAGATAAVGSTNRPWLHANSLLAAQMASSGTRTTVPPVSLSACKIASFRGGELEAIPSAIVELECVIVCKA